MEGEKTEKDRERQKEKQLGIEGGNNEKGKGSSPQKVSSQPAEWGKSELQDGYHSTLIITVFSPCSTLLPSLSC